MLRSFSCVPLPRVQLSASTYLPELRTDLVAGLAGLDVDDLAHFGPETCAARAAPIVKNGESRGPSRAFLGNGTWTDATLGAIARRGSGRTVRRTSSEDGAPLRGTGAFEATRGPGGVIASLAEIEGRNIAVLSGHGHESGRSGVFPHPGDIQFQEKRISNETIRRGWSLWELIEESEVNSGGGSYGRTGDMDLKKGSLVWDGERVREGKERMERGQGMGWKEKVCTDICPCVMPSTL